MRHTITFPTGNKFEIDEQAYLAEMQRNCPLFFKTPHGKRETYDVYRGQLIVRHTVRFTSTSERRTVVYLYLLSGTDPEHRMPDLFCVSGGNKVSCTRDAEKLIDRIIAERRYAYDMDAPVSEIDDKPELTKRITDLLWDYLKKDPEHKDRVRTGWGTKTKLGLRRTVEAALDLNFQVKEKA